MKDETKNTNVKEEKAEEKAESVQPITNSVKEENAPEQKMRKIIIETDGNVINLVLAEVSGKIELVGILQNLIGFINQPTK